LGQNAAESLPAKICDLSSIPGHDCNSPNDVCEPVAPVEAKEKPQCPVCRKPSGDYENPEGCWHNVTAEGKIEYVEPKPTPSTPAESVHNEFIHASDAKGWKQGMLAASLLIEINPNRQSAAVSAALIAAQQKIRICAQSMPQPDSSSIPDWEQEIKDISIAAIQGREVPDVSKNVVIRNLVWAIKNRTEPKTELSCDSSSISGEQTFEDVLRVRAGEYQDMGREHRKSEEYAAACTCEDKASGLYVAIKLYRAWAAAKGSTEVEGK
jgi:hypothetical protein